MSGLTGGGVPSAAHVATRSESFTPPPEYWGEIAGQWRCLGELHRVSRSGGTLLLTVDNPLNPVVAIRNSLPQRLRAASTMVPFAVGATCGPRRLRALLEQTGFDVSRMSAVFHCPRVLVVLGGHLIDRYGGTTTKRRYVRLWTALEGLGSLPTRFLTGYFVAALAHKR